MFAAFRTSLAAAALLVAFGAVSMASLVALACPMAAPPVEQSLPPCHGPTDEAPTDAPVLCCLAAPTDAATALASLPLPEAPVYALAALFADEPTMSLSAPTGTPAHLRAPPPGPSPNLTTRLLI